MKKRPLGEEQGAPKNVEDESEISTCGPNKGK